MRPFVPLVVLVLTSCAAPLPEGLRAAEPGPGPAVVFDIFRKPLPEIPLPNDFATRFDGHSPTHLTINVAVESAPTAWERRTRAGINTVSGWGTLAPITVAFSEPLDLRDLMARHQAPADTQDDALFVLDVTESSPEHCAPQLLDLGQGHFPTVLDRPDYYPDEPHAAFEQLLFEQENEDLNGNGQLDPGEDTDMDGVLDRPNVLGLGSGRFDVLSFYERETNTLIARPLYPMREATTYAVVLTKRLRGEDGNPVRSPFKAINHLQQTSTLEGLPVCLERLGLSLDDVAFTWAFTTQSITSDYIALREGLYGRGTLSWLSKDFPAEVASLEDVRNRAARDTNTKIVPGDTFLSFGSRLFEMYGGAQTEGTKQVLTDGLKFVDFYAAGSFASPQLFPRENAEGERLPLYDQVWNLNARTGESYVRREDVHFFMAAPKGRKGPAPVVIFMHGHTSSKIDSLLLMGPFARFGMATIGMDAVGHGIGISEVEQLMVTEMLKPYGLDPLGKAILKGRAVDHNGDGVVDSGIDFFTPYVLHTRDNIRQTALDLMQLIRTLRSFDGERRWAFDVNRDGEPDLAGDFDGDGQVDLGGPSVPIYVGGASLGGILTSVMGGLEPEIDAILAILPGGYLSEIGPRSSLGQVRDAMVLRMMAPLMLVHPDESGAMALFQLVPSLTKGVELKVASLGGPLRPGSIAVLHNLDNGEWRCGRVQANGHLRVAVTSDRGDRLRLELYEHELPSRHREGCEPEGTPALVIDSFAEPVSFEGRDYPVGSPLVAVTDGFGLKRGSPDLRRLLNFAQIVLEPADPANFAPFYEQHRVFSYGEGGTVATRSLMVPMTGDSGVPIATAAALLRAAGHLDYRNVDPRYGKTAQQVLIDTGFVEGVERTGRHLDSQGRPVLMDVDVLSAAANADDGFDVPRLNPPIRLLRQSGQLGGTVGALFPHMSPYGDHSFPVPDPNRPFDLGMMLINIFAYYLGSGGEHVALEPCMEDTSCPWIRPVPQ